MPILRSTRRGKAVCHHSIVTLDLAIRCIPGRLLARWPISVPVTSAREHAALSTDQGTLASVSEHAGGAGQVLARYVVREFEDFLKCGRLAVCRT